MLTPSLIVPMQSMIFPARSNSNNNSAKRSRLQFGCARITSAMCGSVNLILIVDLIGHISGQGWLPDFTFLGRFGPYASGDGRFPSGCRLYLGFCHDLTL